MNYRELKKQIKILLVDEDQAGAMCGKRTVFQDICSRYGIKPLIRGFYSVAQIEAAKTIAWFDDWKPSKIKTDNPSARLANALRCRIGNALRRNSGKRAGRTVELIGCSISELRQWLESQFKPGMSWANYGQWHVDHRRPCKSFDLTKPEAQMECFHFRNLQPLWSRDNLRKSAKI